MTRNLREGDHSETTPRPHGHFGQPIRLSGPEFARSKPAIHRPARTGRDPSA